MNRCSSHRPRKRKSLLDRGVTIIELLVVLGVISILGSIAYVNYTGAAQTSERAKLEADVKTLNAAVPLFLSNGGSFDGSETEEQVLDLLKTAAGNENAAGLSGSLIDLRIQTERQSSAEGATSQARAVWNSTSRRFEIQMAGAAAVKRFVLGDPTGGNATARTPGLAYATNSTWLWEFTNAVATNTSGGTNPVTVVGATNQPAVAVTKLSPPTITPPGGARSLTEYQPTLTVTLANPNPAGAVYYSLGGGGRTAYTTPIQAPVGATVLAWVEANGAANWINSDITTATFDVAPFTPVLAWSGVSSVTFHEAGGTMVGMSGATPPNIDLSVTLTGVHPDFISSGNFEIFYTTDGSDPASSGISAGAFSGGSPVVQIPAAYTNWASGAPWILRAVAKKVSGKPFFEDSAEATKSVSIVTTALSSPAVEPQVLSPVPSLVTLSLPEVHPQNARIFYTTAETPPSVGDSGEPLTGQLYTAPFAPASTNPSRVNAMVFGPQGLEFWFQPSTQMGITYVEPSYGEGAFVGGAALYGTFVGNLIYASPRPGQTMQDITFYGNSYISKGNLYLPGTPQIYLTWVGESQRWTTARDSMFSTQVQGRQFLANGTEIVPATIPPSPRVVDQGEKLDPTNYKVILHSGTRIEGKIFRQSDTPALPTVAAPPPKDNSRSIDYGTYRVAPNPVYATNYANVTLNSGTPVRLAPGNFGRLEANNGTAFILGDPLNPDVEQVYNIEQLTLNSGSDIIVVGKTTINLSKGMAINNGSVVGSAANAAFLTVNIYSPVPSNPSNFAANSGSSFYGRIVAPDSRVDLNNGSVFSGSVTSKYLQITSASVAFTLPPVIGS